MFKTREEAGKLLGKKIKEDIKEEKPGFKNFIVLGIPRGGVVVAKEVAKTLGCSLDVIMVKKIGAPGQPELALGAVGKIEGSLYLDEGLIANLGVDRKYIEDTKILRYKDIREREKLYREGRQALDLKDKVVIIVDDGAATGATVISAVREVWDNEPKKIIIALPVVAKDTLGKLEKEADEVVYLEAPEMFFSVGEFYQNFPQVKDEEVRKILSNE